MASSSEKITATPQPTPNVPRPAPAGTWPAPDPAWPAERWNDPRRLDPARNTPDPTMPPADGVPWSPEPKER